MCQDFLLKQKYSTVYICENIYIYIYLVYLFIHQWTLGLFPPLATVDNAALNMVFIDGTVSLVSLKTVTTTNTTGDHSACRFGWISPLFSLVPRKSFSASCLSGKVKIFLWHHPLLVIEVLRDYWFSSMLFQSDILTLLNNFCRTEAVF